jgi:DNA-binding Lrp family transcriptional regulator
LCAEILVLINTDAYSAEEVLQELRAYQEVQECFMVTGAYDIVANVEGETFDQLVNVINSRIKRLFQVQETLSMIIVEPKGTEQEQEKGVTVA